MPTAEEYDRVERETQETLELFERLKKQDESFQRDKARYESETGMSFEDYAEQQSELRQRFASQIDVFQQSELDRDQAEFEAGLEQEIAEAQARHKMDRVATRAPKRHRRMRNMV